jgi:hypothetical protein
MDRYGHIESQRSSPHDRRFNGPFVASRMDITARKAIVGVAYRVATPRRLWMGQGLRYRPATLSKISTTPPIQSSPYTVAIPIISRVNVSHQGRERAKPTFGPQPRKIFKMDWVVVVLLDRHVFAEA